MPWNQLGRADFPQTVSLIWWIWVSASTTWSGYRDMQMFQLLRAYRHSSDRNSWSSRYPSFGDIPMMSFDTDGLVMSNISGPIYMNPHTFETAYLFIRIGPPTIRNQWIRWPKPHIFETALQSGFFWVRQVFLKPDIFEANSIINSGMHLG